MKSALLVAALVNAAAQGEPPTISLNQDEPLARLLSQRIELNQLTTALPFIR
jgi:hypothetical protein